MEMFRMQLVFLLPREPGAYVWLMIIMEVVKKFTGREALSVHPYKVIRRFDCFDLDIIG